MAERKRNAVSLLAAIALAFSMLGATGTEALAATMPTLKLTPIVVGEGDVITSVYGVYDGGYAVIRAGKPEDEWHKECMVDSNGKILYRDYDKVSWFAPYAYQKAMFFFDNETDLVGLMKLDGTVIAPAEYDRWCVDNDLSPSYYLLSKYDSAVSKIELALFDDEGAPAKRFAVDSELPGARSSISIAQSNGALFVKVLEEKGGKDDYVSVVTYYKIEGNKCDKIELEPSEWEDLFSKSSASRINPLQITLPNGVLATGKPAGEPPASFGPVRPTNYQVVNEEGQKIKIGDYTLSMGNDDGVNFWSVFARPNLDLYYVSDEKGHYGISRFDGALVTPLEFDQLFDLGNPSAEQILVRKGSTWYFLDLKNLAPGYEEEPQQEPVTGSWKKDATGWWYDYGNGEYPKSQWEFIDGEWYHFNGAGYMQTGWLNLDGTWYYLKPSGVRATGWENVGGSWYYLMNTGAMATGWMDLGAERYYLQSSGAMVTGWQNIAGAWYYFEPSGIMKTGWLSDGGTWYYLQQNGIMATGWIELDGTWYYLKDSGAMATGWENINGTWYNLEESGAMKTGWDNVDGTWYYLKDSGAMASGWENVDGTWYYLEPSGAMATGWEKVGNIWYYLEPSGAMKTGWLSDAGTWYYLNDSGAMAAGWLEVDDAWYYLAKSGDMKIGWQKVSGSWYYLEGSGAMATGWLTSGDTKYYLDDSGAMATGWQKVDDEWYYMAGSGAVKTGWQKINGSWYYLEDSGAMATGWLTNGGAKYYLKPSGVMATGWLMIDGDWYYFQPSGAMTKSKWVDDYYLTYTGAMAKNVWIDQNHFDENGKIDETR